MVPKVFELLKLIEMTDQTTNALADPSLLFVHCQWYFCYFLFACHVQGYLGTLIGWLVV